MSQGSEQGFQIRYFAALREQAGRTEERFLTSAATPSELYGELARKYRFTLEQKSLRVAVNGEFAAWENPLQPGDSIVFIPPVAGG